MVDTKKKCPSCGYTMLGGVYCPQCAAKLVDDVTAEPDEEYERNFAKKIAGFVADELTQRESKKDGKDLPTPDPTPTPEPIPEPIPAPTAKRKGFFGRKQ